MDNKELLIALYKGAQKTENALHKTILDREITRFDAPGHYEKIRMASLLKTILLGAMEELEECP